MDIYEAKRIVYTEGAINNNCPPKKYPRNRRKAVFWYNLGMIIGINNRDYQAYRKAYSKGSFNGAYFYAKEIEENIIPLVNTDYNWDLLGMRMTEHMDHSLIFIHHNVEWDSTYSWLHEYKDIILVCSSWKTYAWATGSGYKAIFLPLSIDVDYVKQFKRKKKFGACYAGNKWKFKTDDLAKYVPAGVDCPPADMPREELLKFIAPYKQCYAIGRCAIEARVLGCEILKCDSRYEPEDFQVLDNKEAASILQRELDKLL